jgi:hypothetical protein
MPRIRAWPSAPVHTQFQLGVVLEGRSLGFPFAVVTCPVCAGQCRGMGVARICLGTLDTEREAVYRIQNTCMSYLYSGVFEVL